MCYKSINILLQLKVPIGKHAFIPGQLYHTNEIMVLLGDNWFAQVTAKQARDIVSRRQKGEPLCHAMHVIINRALFAVVEERLSDAKRQLNDIEAKLSFATAFQHQVIHACPGLQLSTMSMPTTPG